MANNSDYFENQDCPAFPCHDIHGEDKHNCIFCFCPFYYMSECLGTPKYLDSGIKDCSSCNFIHQRSNYKKILDKIVKINEVNKPLIKKVREIQTKKSGGL